MPYGILLSCRHFSTLFLHIGVKSRRYGERYIVKIDVAKSVYVMNCSTCPCVRACVYVYLTWSLYVSKYDVHVCACLCTCFCFAYWKTFLWRISFCCCCLYYILRTNSETVIGVKITNWTTLYISLKYIRVWVACFPNLSHYTLNSQFFFVVCSVKLLRVKWWVWVLLNESIWSNDKPNGKLPNHEINLEIWSAIKRILWFFFVNVIVVAASKFQTNTLNDFVSFDYWWECLRTRAFCTNVCRNITKMLSKFQNWEYIERKMSKAAIMRQH